MPPCRSRPRLNTPGSGSLASAARVLFAARTSVTALERAQIAPPQSNPIRIAMKSSRRQYFPFTPASSRGRTGPSDLRRRRVVLGGFFVGDLADDRTPQELDHRAR